MDVVISGDLQYDQTGVRIGVNFTLRNVGSTPAMDTAVNLEAFPLMPDTDVSRARERICSLPTDGSGIDIFPGGKEPPWNRETSITKESVDEFWKQIPAMRPAIFPLIIACIVYRGPVSLDYHHTPFVFNLIRVKSNIKNRDPILIFVDEGRVPASNLRLVLSPWGNGQAD